MTASYRPRFLTLLVFLFSLKHAWCQTNELSAAKEALVQGKWETLIQIADTLKKNSETAVVASDLRRHARYMLGHYNESRNIESLSNHSSALISFYEEMTAECPESVDVRLRLALAYVLASRFSEAIDTLEQARNMDSNNPHILTALGVARKIVGQVDKAIDLQLRAITLDSRLCPAYAALGSAYLFQNKLGDAQRVLQNGVDICPDYALTWFNLGLVFRRQGALDRAIECYEKAISLSPGDPIDYLNLGSAYAHKAEYDKARQAWEKAVGLDPKGSTGASARRNLSRLPH